VFDVPESPLRASVARTKSHARKGAPLIAGSIPRVTRRALMQSAPFPRSERPRNPRVVVEAEALEEACKF